MLSKENISINNSHLIIKKSKLNKKDICQIINSFFIHYKLSINYIDINFIQNEEMLAINKKYLNHHYDTDVITFNLSNDKKEMIADIYINVNMLITNSEIFKSTIEKELKRLIIHACLHLIGKKDKTIIQKKEMRILEDKHIKQFSVV